MELHLSKLCLVLLRFSVTLLQRELFPSTITKLKILPEDGLKGGATLSLLRGTCFAFDKSMVTRP